MSGAKQGKKKARSPSAAAGRKDAQVEMAEAGSSRPASKRPGPEEPPPRTPPASAGEPALSATPLWARALVVASAILTFLRSWQSGLLSTWDDQRFIFDSDVRAPSFSGLVAFFTEQRYEAYHPLHLLSYWLDVPWAGPNGPVIHAVSTLLWCGVLLLALEALRRLGLGLGAALVGTLAFGLHPVMVEPVAWASGRKDVLAIGFALGALLFHLRAERWNDRDAWISRALFVLGALSKTSILTLPLALFLLDLWRGRRPARDAALFQAPMLAAAAALGVVVLVIWRGHSMIRGEAGDEIGVEPLVVPATFTHQLLTALWPADVSPVYPTSRGLSFPWTFALLGPVVLAGVLAWAALRRDLVLAQRVGFGVTWFVVLLLPASNIVPMYFQWQDRYLALPLFGLAVVLGAIVDALATKDTRETWIRSAVTGAVVIVPLAARTAEYVGVWADDRALWHHAITAQPHAYYAWIKLGEARRDDGEYDGALVAYAEAMEIEPNTRLGHAAFVYTLGLRDEREQHLEGESHALSWSTRYVTLADDAPGLRDLAADMIDDGYHDAATFVLGRSLDLDPVGDDRLERACAHHLAAGREWLARFYLGRMSRRPVMPLVVSFYDAERLRLGVVTEEELRGEAASGDGGDPEAPPLPDVDGSGFDTAIDLREP